MKLSDWLTIAAIILGPILALFAQRALDTLRETQKCSRRTATDRSGRRGRRSAST